MGWRISERIRAGLCILVATAWAANVALNMLRPSYESDPSINLAFTAVLGLVLASGSNKDKENKK